MILAVIELVFKVIIYVLPSHLASKFVYFLTVFSYFVVLGLFLFSVSHFVLNRLTSPCLSHAAHSRNWFYLSIYKLKLHYERTLPPKHRCHRRQYLQLPISQVLMIPSNCIVSQVLIIPVFVFRLKTDSLLIDLNMFQQSGWFWIGAHSSASRSVHCQTNGDLWCRPEHAALSSSRLPSPFLSITATLPG